MEKRCFIATVKICDDTEKVEVERKEKYILFSENYGDAANKVEEYIGIDNIISMTLKDISVGDIAQIDDVAEQSLLDLNSF